PGLALHNQVAVAVPVGAYHRKAARHRLKNNQPKRFLDIVRQGQEQICRVPHASTNVGVLTVEEDNACVRREPRGAVAKCPTNAWVRRPAGEDERDFSASSASSLVNGEIGRKGMSLGVV